MGKRDLSLTPRIEDKRDKKAVPPPVHFRLSEIKQHFDESMQSVKEQFTVADNLLSEGNTEGCQIIWRSQIVFAESLLDFFLHEMSKYCLFRMFTGEWEKSEKYKNLEVKMSKVEEGLAAKESDEWFFEYVLQSDGVVYEQFAVLGNINDIARKSDDPARSGLAVVPVQNRSVEIRTLKLQRNHQIAVVDRRVHIVPVVDREPENEDENQPYRKDDRRDFDQ